jgi:membrane-associated phospholipid phosphatase
VSGPDAALGRTASGDDPSRAASGFAAAPATLAATANGGQGSADRLLPLLPAAARRPAAVIAGCCAVLTLVLAVLVAHTSGPGTLDRGADHWLITHLASHHRAMVLLMDLGEPAQAAIIAVAIIAACLAVRRLNGAALTVISYPVAAGLTELVLKPAVGRSLGPFTVYPSGHTSRAVALATIIAVLLIRPAATRRRQALRLTAIAACALLSAGVAVAMISLQFHYFTDTVGGAAVSIAVVLATTFPLDRPGVLHWLEAAGSRFGRKEC